MVDAPGAWGGGSAEQFVTSIETTEQLHRRVKASAKGKSNVSRICRRGVYVGQGGMVLSGEGELDKPKKATAGERRVPNKN